jgi:hypothetical protein
MIKENTNSAKEKELKRHFDFDKAILEFHKLFNLENKEDRTITVLGGTFLEMALEQILRAYLPENEKEVDKLFEYNQPLGTFSSKITTAFCLGLIDKLVKDDLTLVRKIRNKFAHDLFVNFDDPQIASWIKELKIHKILLEMEPPKAAIGIQIFQVGVNTLIASLHGCIGIARDRKCKIKEELKQFL